MSTATSTAPKSGKDLLSTIKPTRKRGRTQICLRPDLVEQWEAANEALAEEVAQKSTRLAGQGQRSDRSVTTKAKAVQKLEAQIEAASIWFEMESMDPDEWSGITDDSPPRPSRQMDLMLGYDPEAAYDAAIKRCTVDPVFETCEVDGCDHTACGTWEALRKASDPSEWEELRRLARDVNQGVTAPPKSHLASSILDRRRSGSARPADGE